VNDHARQRTEAAPESRYKGRSRTHWSGKIMNKLTLVLMLAGSLLAGCVVYEVPGRGYGGNHDGHEYHRDGDAGRNNHERNGEGNREGSREGNRHDKRQQD
jgi:hypothetical protein